MIKLGTNLPEHLIGTDQGALAEFLRAIKELGYGPEPYCIADALMYADGKPIVEMTNMALKITGLTREKLDAIWGAFSSSPPLSGEGPGEGFPPATASSPSPSSPTRTRTKPATSPPASVGRSGWPSGGTPGTGGTSASAWGSGSTPRRRSGFA